LTDHVMPQDQNDGLFRTAGPDERQLASDVSDFKLITRPSRSLFYNAVNHKAAEQAPPNTRRDEATMRSLRFPFDEVNSR